MATSFILPVTLAIWIFVCTCPKHCRSHTKNWRREKGKSVCVCVCMWQ